MAFRGDVSVVIDSVLLESDLPDLLLARDQVSTMYLCSLAKADPNGFRFLAVQVSSARLADFRSGRMDLRSLLLDPEMGRHFTAHAPAGPLRPQSMQLSPFNETVPEDWLPESGFLFTAFEPRGVADDVVVRDAIAKNAPVIVCTLNPPESRGTEPKITADSLADYIAHFQSLVRHATKDTLRSMSRKERQAAVAEDFFTLNVRAFSPGSFNIHFETKDRADLFGLSRIGEALKRVDALMGLAKKSPEEARAGFKRNPGHVLAAYESLLKFASEAQIPFSYRWSDPGMAVPSGNAISPVEAAAMVAVLAHEEELKSEPFDFIGHFTSVNTDKKPWSWTARDEDRKVRRGYVDDSSPLVLDGVRIKTQSYLFVGQDRLVEPTHGRLTHRLFLSSVSELS